jgi:hypothetical protein
MVDEKEAGGLKDVQEREREGESEVQWVVAQ